MAIISLIRPEIIKIPLEATTQPDVIRELVETLKAAGQVENTEVIYDAVMAREAQCSTGLEQEIAVPHAKTEAVSDLMLAIGIAPHGVETGALDGKPSKIFFLMLAPPDKSGPHIEALADIARIADSPMFLRQLIASTSAEDMVELFSEE
ncbi:MAG: PTS sugar transporter subunit IIA [Planctomycetota bacterium]|jgi:mannitol/fructose-specific phosphotransferase system IIA component (Ntr-type)